MIGVSPASQSDAPITEAFPRTFDPSRLISWVTSAFSGNPVGFKDAKRGGGTGKDEMVLRVLGAQRLESVVSRVSPVLDVSTVRVQAVLVSH